MKGIQCDRCGRFCVPAEWKMVYSGYPPEPDREAFRCAECVQKHGSFEPQYGIKPIYSCGTLTNKAKP